MLYVANWKMVMTFAQECAWYKEHLFDLQQLVTPEIELVLCPSFVSLAIAQIAFKGMNIKLGAQSCSAYDSGAYTGEISAHSLSELDCSYALVGHSERRQHLWCTNESIAQSVQRLIACNIIPIVCVGETAHERDAGLTYQIIESQLKPIFDIINDGVSSISLIVAYEPVWSIGTGLVLDNQFIAHISQHIRVYIEKNYPLVSVRVLYGGSVNSDTIVQLKKGCAVDGFLIGGASTRFQEFKNIVSLY
jgi:triosephosphate isomerase (TIM)